MYRALRASVAEALEAALAAEGYPTDDLGLEEPPADVDAVLASSVAFRLADEAGAPPPQVAAELADALDPDAIDYVASVETQGPYLNFLPADAYFAGTLAAAEDVDFGALPERDTSVVVEHTSANPTGPVHVGRARNPIIGDALARVLDMAGYDVETHYYVNDAGRQLAVFTWAYETFDEADLPEPERDKPDYDLVRYYRKGNEFLESGDETAVEDAEDEIQAIMQGLEAGDEATYERVGEVVDTVLSGMRESLERLPAEFDRFVKETEFMRDGATDDVVARLKELDAAVYEENAWQLNLPDIDKNLVFLRSDGTSLYSTRDVAHHEWKFEHFDRAVTVLGEDHGLQARQIETTLDLLGHDTDRLDQVLYSYVNLPEGKMSTRKGTGIDLDDLLDEAVARAREEVEDRLDDRIRGNDLDEADVSRIARQVGIGAVRYDIVAKQPTKAITFEWEHALDFEAQSAPYVQYVHARTCGILDEAVARAREEVEDRLDDRIRGDDLAEADVERIARQVGIGAVRYDIVAKQPTKAITFEWERALDFEAQSAPYVQYVHARTCGILDEASAAGFGIPDTGAADADMLTDDAERDLLRTVARFPAVIEEAADDLQPHVVATYLRDVAEDFNAFYRECPVIDADPERRTARLALVVAARNTVANALGALGIEAPDSM